MGFPKTGKWAMLPVILSLSLPTMLEQLMQTAVQYIDTAMVGSLGTSATAAVGVTTTVNWLVNSSITALGVGFLAFISRCCGAGDRDGAARAAGQAVLAVGVVGTVYTALALSLSSRIPVWMQADPAIRETAARYFFILSLPILPRAASILLGTVLRAAGDTRTPMKIGLLVNVVNVALNFLLIYPARQLALGPWTLPLPGAGLGVEGAAAASAAAFTLGGLCTAVAVWRHPIISPRGRRLRPDRQVLVPCLRVALPNMLQRFAANLGYVAFASMINALGETATAAHTIANTVESAFYIPGYGMQTAAATLAGNALGAGDRQRMRDLTAMLIPIEVTLMAVSGGLLFLLAPDMVGLFSHSAAVIVLGAAVLRMVALSEPFYGVSIILEGVLQGVGQTRVPFVFNLTGMWGVRILGTLICTRLLGLGLVSAWGCMIAHNLLLFVAYAVYFRHGRWDPLGRAGQATSGGIT
ncbi:MATE family efflux transporter [Dysosmobacter sp.]|uniref:MATE family efflux transporter n=1 Tax=Dysosmobacter sp. TaxID=2591382 RepID=UPI002A85FC26|nr:MATE family efflux transporter [Dysosmobacter sp.]MDY3281813.1 MATE family efflux transporter [Dysosmobacter sp.]